MRLKIAFHRVHENISDPDVPHPSNDSSITETRSPFQRYRTTIWQQ